MISLIQKHSLRVFRVQQISTLNTSAHSCLGVRGAKQPQCPALKELGLTRRHKAHTEAVQHESTITETLASPAGREPKGRSQARSR